MTPADNDDHHWRELPAQRSSNLVNRSVEHEAEISVFQLGSVLLRNRWRIVRLAIVGGFVAVVPGLLSPTTWTSTASFVPQESDAGEAGIRSLAGQFGVVIPGRAASAARSPEFYVDLLSSRVVLGQISGDSLRAASEQDRQAVQDLFGEEASDSAVQRVSAIRSLRSAIHTTIKRATSAVELSVTTQSPTVSHAIATDLLAQINRFNLESRQSQAAAERHFVEQRMEVAKQALLKAEGGLSRFLQANRQFDRSPDLQFEYDRLQRDVALHQEVLVSLAQSYEEARIREVRNLPVISVVEPPSIPVHPDSKRLPLRLLVGLVIGAFLAVIIAFVREVYERSRDAGDADALTFTALLREARGDLTRLVKRRTSTHGIGP